MNVNDIVQNMGYCGLICTLCHEADKCAGCKSDNNCCGRHLSEKGCFQFDCCVKKGINGCWECKDSPCDKDMLSEHHDIRNRTFVKVAKNEGIEKLAEYVVRNQKNGIMYGWNKDYDNLGNEEAIIDLLHNGTNRKYWSDNGEKENMFENKLGQPFDNLGKRIIYAHLATYPEFKPVANCGASELSQKQMYDFLYDCIKTIYNDLLLIKVDNEPDECYEYWQCNNVKPELILKMQKIEKNFFDFFEYFLKMGIYGEVIDSKLVISKSDMLITKNTKDKLSLFGLICDETKDSLAFIHNRYDELFPAWKLHSSVPKDGKIRTTHYMMIFLHGRFGGKQYTAAEMFGKISNMEQIATLERYFLVKGYISSNNEMGIKYEKEYPKRQKAYMHIYFDCRKKDQLVFEFKVPQFSTIIKSYDKMEGALKELVFYRTKTCNGCGYCNQTDKTGKRPRLALPLTRNEQTLIKCPLYPAFVWFSVDETMIHIVTKLFDFAEETLKRNDIIVSTE